MIQWPCMLGCTKSCCNASPPAPPTRTPEQQARIRELEQEIKAYMATMPKPINGLER